MKITPRFNTHYQIADIIFFVSVKYWAKYLNRLSRKIVVITMNMPAIIAIMLSGRMFSFVVNEILTDSSVSIMQINVRIRIKMLNKISITIVLAMNWFFLFFIRRASTSQLIWYCFSIFILYFDWQTSQVASARLLISFFIYFFLYIH